MTEINQIFYHPTILPPNSPLHPTDLYLDLDIYEGLCGYLAASRNSIMNLFIFSIDQTMVSLVIPLYLISLVIPLYLI